MIRLRHIVPLLLVPLMLAAPVRAQDFPTRPVTSFGPFGAGGGADTVLRALGGVIEPHLGQPLVHVNKPGGASTVAAAAVASGKPDGYTVVSLVSPGAVPEIYKHFREVPYTSKDLRPVLRITSFPYCFYVNSESPWKNVDDLMAAAKAKPGQLSYAHAGRGHVYHLLIEAVTGKAGAKMRDVPTKGAGPALKNLLGKHIDAAVGSCTSGKKFTEAGDLRVVAVQHKGRMPWIPDVKTFAEQDYDMKLSPWYLSMFVHAKAPDAHVKKLHDAVKASLEEPKFLEIMKKVGLDIDYADASGVLTDMENDKVVLAALLKKLGFWKD